MAFRELELMRADLVPLVRKIINPERPLNYVSRSQRDAYNAGQLALLYLYEPTSGTFDDKGLVPIADAQFAVRQYAGLGFYVTTDARSLP